MIKLLVYLSTLVLFKGAFAVVNDFTLHFDSVEVVSFNKDYSDGVQLKIVVLDDGTQAFSGSGTLKKDLERDIKVNIEALKLQDNNEYKVMSTLTDLDFCDLLDKNALGLKDFLKYGNFTVCPWKAGTYAVNNGVIDISQLPPMPFGKYTVTSRFSIGTTELISFKSVTSVIPKKS